MSEELKAAQARIACLEGEIAKRDARVAELEARYQRDVYGLNNEGDPIGGDPAGGYANDNARLRTELAAIKAQEPVARLPACPSRAFAVANLRDLAQSVMQHDPDVGMFRDEDQAYLINELADLAEAFNGDVKLYAAPVSEAKAQCVVMPEPELASEINRLIGLWDAQVGWSGQCMEELLDHAAKAATFIASLNASPVQQPKCKTCDDNGRIGGPSFYAPDEGGEPCPDCSAPVQQVSVPDERIIPTSAELIQWAWEEEPEETRFQEGYNAAKRWVKMQIEAGIAAPAAPAADAGLVEALEKIAAYAPCSGIKDPGFTKMHMGILARDAIAAHRAKGVV